MMILELFQGSVGKTGACFFSDPFQMSLFVCDFFGSIFPVKPEYFIILQNSLNFLLIRLSLFSRTAMGLISFLYSFHHYPEFWGRNVEVYMYLVCHLGIEAMILALIHFLIYCSYLSTFTKVRVGCCVFYILALQRMCSTLSYNHQLGIKFSSQTLCYPQLSDIRSHHLLTNCFWFSF